jgi:hypothetical protein
MTEAAAPGGKATARVEAGAFDEVRGSVTLA